MYQLCEACSLGSDWMSQKQQSCTVNCIVIAGIRDAAKHRLLSLAAGLEATGGQELSEKELTRLEAARQGQLSACLPCNAMILIAPGNYFYNNL